MTAAASPSAASSRTASPAAARAAIRVRNVHKRFGSRDALAGVSFEVPQGSCVAVLGRNGSGKTTLVRILATLWTPGEGDVEIAGHALPRDDAAARARIGVVLDHPFLPRDLRLDEGLRFHAELFGVEDPVGRVEALAERFGLRTRLADPVRTLSRGMTQRASICRALLHDPAVLLLDEPSSALDAEGCRLLVSVLRETAAAGRAILLVTHDLALAGDAADRAILLRRGRVAGDGSVREIAALAAAESSDQERSVA